MLQISTSTGYSGYCVGRSATVSLVKMARVRQCGPVDMHLVAAVMLVVCCGMPACHGAINSLLAYRLEEEQPVDSSVGRIFRDSGIEAEYGEAVAADLYLVFADTTEENVDLFSLENGKDLKTSKPVDRDALCPGRQSCVIQLTMHLQPDDHFQIIRVSITVLDTNDNLPSFPKAVEKRSLLESASEGTKIPLPTATDPDSPAHGVLEYSINDPSGLFELAVTNDSSDVTLFLLLKGRLDRETKDVYHVEMFAHELRQLGAMQRQGQTTIQITILDINDNAPIFERQVYQSSVPENIHRYSNLLQVNATDRDAGDNAAIVYEFDAKTKETYGSLFRIGAETGNISVIGELDYETMDAVTLIVTARNKDPSSQPVFTKILLEITDVNDNPPKIKVRGISDEGEIRKSEAAGVGDFVAHVTVTDPDSGVNKKFNCSLNTDTFRLQQKFETDFVIVTNAELDRESRSQYYLEMSCVDFGSPQQSASQYITVVVEDENDNKPLFTRSVYGASLLENNQANKYLLQVQAYDRDDGLNGDVRYRIPQDLSEILEIDERVGNITALISFDHERASRLEFEVIAYDLGQPVRHSASATVIIEIFDRDDELPEFSEFAYSFWVYENQSIKSAVGRVNATDADSKPFNQFTYALDYDGGDAESFSIETKSGRIYTTSVLDREAQPVYEFLALAVTSGIHPRTTSVTVTVHAADINDNAPTISFPTRYNNTIYLSTAETPSQVVSQILASDVDFGKNAELVFSILSGNDGDVFSVDVQTGAVSVSKELSQIHHKVFGLVLLVADKGTPPRTSEAYLNIIVNSSLAHIDSSLMSTQNLTIVIAIATISGLLMVVLIVAIVILLRWPKILGRNPRKLKYNYVARVADQKTLEHYPSTLTISEMQPGSSKGHLPSKKLNNDEVSVREQHPACNDSGFINMSFVDCKDIDSYTKRELQKKMGQINSPGYPEILEKDVVSIGSADGSTGTDSGRGSNGSNEDVGIDGAGTEGGPGRNGLAVPTRGLLPGVHRPRATSPTPAAPSPGPLDPARHQRACPHHQHHSHQHHHNCRHHSKNTETAPSHAHSSMDSTAVTAASAAAAAAAAAAAYGRRTPADLFHSPYYRGDNRSHLPSGQPAFLNDAHSSSSSRVVESQANNGVPPAYRAGHDANVFNPRGYNETRTASKVSNEVQV